MSKIGTSFYETKHIQTTTTKIRRLRIGDLYKIFDQSKRQ